MFTVCSLRLAPRLVGKIVGKIIEKDMTPTGLRPGGAVFSLVEAA
jgi:hypothetical protein